MIVNMVKIKIIIKDVCNSKKLYRIGAVNENLSIIFIMTLEVSRFDLWPCVLNSPPEALHHPILKIVHLSSFKTV